MNAIHAVNTDLNTNNEVTNEAVQPTIMPANHPVNRLGTLLESNQHGNIYGYRGVFYAWRAAEDMARGYECPTFVAAMEALRGYGAVMRVGYDDEGFGSNKLGHCIEKHGTTEIWKHQPSGFAKAIAYYVWEEDADQAICTSTLFSAREQCNVTPKASASNRTPPKSSYKQNQKGYRADTAKK